MIEVQCTSCHTRYRIDEQVLPEGLPTFKCSRCGHVFTFEPRKSRLHGSRESTAPKEQTAADSTGVSSAYWARPPDPPEPSPGVAGRIFRTGSPSSSESSIAASNSDVSDKSPAEADPSHFQSDPTENEEPALGTPERASATMDAPARKAEPGPAGMMSPPRPILSPQPRSQQDEESYSRLITEKDPDAASGENLSFDFADEEPVHDQARLTGRRRRKSQAPEPSDRDSEKWEVGYDELAPSLAGSIDNQPQGEEELVRPRRKIRSSDTEPQFTDDTEFVDEEVAPVYNRAMTHSARFFLLLVFLVGAGFAALTLLIRSAPADSSAALSYLPVVGDRFVIPATPAKLVALRDVHAAYQRSKEGQHTLVISGTAENIGTASLRIVQLTAALRDAQHRSLASEAVYCGNSVSGGMIGEMTAHEIEFFQRLEPARTFALEPSGSCRFVAVFMNPPSAARAYDVSVSQAVPGMPPNGEEPAS
jgi:predicted Zn finger-like uncharacterized protein